MQTWIEEVRASIAERAASNQAEEQRLEVFKHRTTPVIERLRRLIDSMPESERDLPRSLEFYRGTLKAKHSGKHAHPGKTGSALRALGYIRKRNWSDAENGFRAIWYPPVKGGNV